jgi:hypothetical protein
MVLNRVSFESIVIFPVITDLAFFNTVAENKNSLF